MARREQDYEKPANKKVTPPEQPEWSWQFNTAWILVPLALLGMAYLFTNARSSIEWKEVMDFLGVTNDCAAYVRLFHLGLIVVFIVAAARILGRKDKQ
ncbi:hypothetical protein ACFL5Z_09585 [Planctomycetota bacterium]